MTVPFKPFKFKNASEVDRSSGTTYFTNPDKNTAIVVPTKVVNAIHKVNGNTILTDSLATALHLRSFGNDDEIIQNWHETSYDMYAFPKSTSNERFSKFMFTIFKEVNHELTDTEVDYLIFFFARVPHGFKLPRNFIHCHTELKHDIL
ncbi:hypothetical protein PTQ21_12305 [Paenibacillus marchantiae]|uniref:hypothetical protein n=1 Tax=Paenibacillus marchantiae TaxID=3026433 RepID=UPI00237AAF12|nr:hypothetical protein [Paenibacillus marchantiae]WDQ34971.1 hypothetical protein PTQ21_12305 [Paenibacillus marchantiae]